MLNSAGVIIGVTTAGSNNSAGTQDAAGGTRDSAQSAVVDATPINVARAWIAQITITGADDPGLGTVAEADASSGSSPSPSDRGALTDH